MFSIRLSQTLAMPLITATNSSSEVCLRSATNWDQNSGIVTMRGDSMMPYSASATTSFTSGIIRFIIPSIPAFRVIMDEGHPEQEPCSIRLTVPSL